MKEQPSPSFSFRLPPDLAQRLEAEAEKAGLSRGEYARELVVEALSNARHEQVRNDIAHVQDEVVKLREDFATAVTALLTRDGPIPVDEAKAWVRSRLLG